MASDDPKFPSEQSTDELFQFFSIPQQDSSNHRQKKDEHDLTHLSEDGINVVVGKRKTPTASGSKKQGNNPSHEVKKKKIIHRNIERQRRQEMNTLYATLRSLLPLEYLKGKRSISDHMHEAVKYIKHLQNRITELSDRRDELKRRSTHLQHKPDSMPPENSLTECPEEDSCHVEVRACFVGAEVVINTGLRRGLLLSNVLEVLVAEGLNVVSCVSTNVNERVLHTIISEVNDQRSIELSKLQKKLAEVIISNSNSCFKLI